MFLFLMNLSQPRTMVQLGTKEDKTDLSTLSYLTKQADEQTGFI